LKNLYPALPGYPDRQDKVKISSAWLIEQCGWKGKRINDAGVHEKHALILVNHGNATGKEIKQLEEMIRQDVVEKFGIGLEPEVNIV
jgi:UDP-N-acetylmuramate dehydrogenase